MNKSAYAYTRWNWGCGVPQQLMILEHLKISFWGRHFMSCDGEWRWSAIKPTTCNVLSDAAYKQRDLCSQPQAPHFKQTSLYVSWDTAQSTAMHTFSTNIINSNYNSPTDKLTQFLRAYVTRRFDNCHVGYLLRNPGRLRFQNSCGLMHICND